VSQHYFSENPTSPEKRGLIRTRLRGLDFEFETSSGVFSHKRVDSGTRLLVESMKLPEEGRVLDLGCGYGVVGIVAAKLNPALEVWMTDVNSRAASLAEANARRNGVKVTVRQGSLYEPVGSLKFDLIVTNPPISAGIDAAVRPMIVGAPAHLVGDGSLQLVVQSNKGGRTLSGIIEETFGNIEITSRGGGFRVFTALKRL
jgi:16S rRNA (guanine1207-N2)-methyltransferase